MESPSQELLTPEGGKPQKPRPQDLLSVKEEPRHYKISVGIAMNELDKKYSHEVRVDLATKKKLIANNQNIRQSSPVSKRPSVFI